MAEVIYNMNYADYAARPGARSSQLKTILERSPAHSRIQAPDSGAFRIGRAIHSACLTPNMFPMQFSQVTDRRTKDGNSKTLAKSWSGSRRKAWVLSTPTMLSGVSS